MSPAFPPDLTPWLQTMLRRTPSGSSPVAAFIRDTPPTPWRTSMRYSAGFAPDQDLSPASTLLPQRLPQWYEGAGAVVSCGAEQRHSDYVSHWHINLSWRAKQVRGPDSYRRCSGRFPALEDCACTWRPASLDEHCLFPGAPSCQCLLGH